MRDRRHLPPLRPKALTQQDALDIQHLLQWLTGWASQDLREQQQMRDAAARLAERSYVQLDGIGMNADTLRRFWPDAGPKRWRAGDDA